MALGPTGIARQYQQASGRAEKREAAERSLVPAAPPLQVLDLGKAKQINVRMMPDELDAIDNARGSMSRQDFLRKAALYLADQAAKAAGR